MSERAHPDDPGFKDQWIWRRRFKGLLPWPYFVRSLWKNGLFERYSFCQTYADNKRVADIPCGVGWGTSLLRKTKKLVGLDINEDAIQYAISHFNKFGNFLCADMRKLPFFDESFDLILCLEGIEHVSVRTGKEFVSEAARVLTDFGRLIVTNPLPSHDRSTNPHHIHEYEFAELKSLLDLKFTIELSQVRNIEGLSIVYCVGVKR